MNKFLRVASAGIGLHAEAVIIRSPITYLSHSIGDRQLIAGIVMSDLFLERAGFKRLKKYFDEKYIPTERDKNLKFTDVYHWLLEFQLIDRNLNDRVSKIHNYRNKIAHEIDHPDLLNENEAIKIIETAIECLKALGEVCI